MYYNKFTKSGVALRGFYSCIRHPQYLGLALTGLGLSILWPRFLVAGLWVVMAALYYLLAKDEERRMLGQFDDTYRQYMEQTGMFPPKPVEAAFLNYALPRNSFLRAALVFLLLVIAIGGGIRRMIFLRLDTRNDDLTPSALFGINTLRSPLFLADVDIHNLVLQEVRELQPETAWGRVPTPTF